MDWSADVTISGTLASVGARMIEGTANKMSARPSTASGASSPRAATGAADPLAAPVQGQKGDPEAMAEDAARELSNLPLEDALPARPPVRGARLAEVREGSDALARALPDRRVAEAPALCRDHDGPREARAVSRERGNLEMATDRA